MNNSESSNSFERKGYKEDFIKPVKIWEVVKRLEESTEEVSWDMGTMRATLIVNFGKEGRCIKNIINETEGTFQMFIIVLNYYHDNFELKRGGK